MFHRFHLWNMLTLWKYIKIYTYHKTINMNSKFRIDYSIACYLLIENTKFNNRKTKLWTYASAMNDIKSQIDFILIRRKWWHSLPAIHKLIYKFINLFMIYNSFSNVGSHHRLIRATIKISLRMSKTHVKKEDIWLMHTEKSG